MASPHDEAEAFAALASGVRIEIMRSLSERPKTVQELSHELDLHRLTVKHHLDHLQRERMVEQTEPRREGKAGRPAAVYAAMRSARLPSYPPRHFEIIAEAALASLSQALGEEAARELLRERGRQMGRSMIAAVAAQHQIAEWTPAQFEAHILRGLFKDFGVASQVLSSSEREISYRSFVCPFLEIAEKAPSAVCNGLDMGFHDGVDEALGHVKTVRKACMGHGDAFCEYALTWGAPSEGMPAGRKPGSPSRG